MSDSVILLADDDHAVRMVVTEALNDMGFEVRATGSAAVLWQWAVAGEGDLVITDVVMPDGDGLDLIPRLRDKRPDLPVIAMSARNTLATAVRATERGAFEYLPKPFDLTALATIVAKALASPPLNRASSAALRADDTPMIGRSAAMQEVYRTLARLAGTDHTVLIGGESGVGKALVARALHSHGRRPHGPFIRVAFGGMSAEQGETALFGISGVGLPRHKGSLAAARGGTLFLANVSEASAAIQSRMAQMLHDDGGVGQGARLDCRIVAATTVDLHQAVRAGRFREDLYYRLNVVPLRVPPLRERVQDIADLARHFLHEATGRKMSGKLFTAAALERLTDHGWPGNVRELRNVVQRVVTLEAGDEIGADAVQRALDSAASGTTPEPGAESDDGLASSVARHLATYFHSHKDELPATGLYDRILREVERPLIHQCLEATRGNQLKAAELLGLNRNTLRKKIRLLDIPVVRRVK